MCEIEYVLFNMYVLKYLASNFRGICHSTLRDGMSSLTDYKFPEWFPFLLGEEMAESQSDGKQETPVTDLEEKVATDKPSELLMSEVIENVSQAAVMDNR